MTLIRKRISGIISPVFFLVTSGLAIFQLYRRMTAPVWGNMVLLLFFMVCVIVIRALVVAYIVIDDQNVRVRRAFSTDKFAISDVEEVLISTNELKPSKFILKNGRVISFDSNSLRESDISFLRSLKKTN